MSSQRNGSESKRVIDRRYSVTGWCKARNKVRRISTTDSRNFYDRTIETISQVPADGIDDNGRSVPLAVPQQRSCNLSRSIKALSQMNQTAPHFLLFTQANSYSSGGRWKFVLEQIGSESRIVESDDEPNVRGERLQLLAVVRGLEALEEPSHVTLITPSRSVGNGIRSGIKLWCEQDWQVEIDGLLKPLRNADMWRRIDSAMKFHQISCRVWHFDVPQATIQAAANETNEAGRRSSPFVAPFGDAPAYEDQSDRPNRIRIDDQVRNSSFRSANRLMTAAVDVLVDRVKPIGQGRAYGYAVN